MTHQKTPPAGVPRSVLILRLSALGDVLHCLPALTVLRAAWPNVQIDWVCETLSAGLLEGHPDLRTVHHLPRKEWQRQMRRPAGWLDIFRQCRHFVTALRREPYDLVVDLQGNSRSRLVSWLARARYRAGFHRSDIKELRWLPAAHGPPASAGRVHRVRKILHVVEWLVGRDGQAGGGELGVPGGRLPDLRTERERLIPLLRKPGDDAPALVLLHPFVSRFGKFKEWPGERFADLAVRLARPDRRILVIGSLAERAEAERIVQRSRGSAELAPPTENLRELAALISMARVLVAADTGVLHLAAALDVPLVGLYGPKDPGVYGPWSCRGQVVRTRAPCSPCLLRRCEHAVCMQTIGIGEVARAVEASWSIAAKPG